jgi:hypothetical protein
MLLKRPRNLAPLYPNEDLKIVANGNPYFCEGLPIKFEKKIN